MAVAAAVAVAAVVVVTVAMVAPTVTETAKAKAGALGLKQTAARRRRLGPPHVPSLRKPLKAPKVTAKRR